MFLRRALGLFAWLRPAAPLRGPARFIHGLNCRDSTWRKQHVNLMLMLSGPTTIFFGLCKNSVFAGDSSMADNVESEGYLTGLRRIEDGSVISNTHTSKWRIFTDNGRELFLKGKLDEAEKYFQLALYEAKEGFGLRDPHVASSCNNLAELYRVRKEFEKAEPLYLEAINILEESFGLDDIRVAAALHNLGQCYLAQRKLEQARACYERALKIKGRVLGYGHPDYADTMYHLGTVLHLQGKEKDAEALIQESIKILEEGGQGETMTCIRRMKYLSQMLLKSNQVAEAENLQRKILHILEISKGWNSMDTVVAAEDLALTLQALGCLGEAHELLERCLDVRKKLLPEDHIQIAANSLHLARVVILNSSHQRKMKISEASAELDKAKHFLDNSIRIAKQVLDRLRKNQISLQNTHMPAESGEDVRAALLILLQSLDSVGLLEAARLELQGSEETHTFPSEAELALRECISIVKESGLLSCLLNSPDIKVEYLSCLKHLMNLLSEHVDSKTQKSRELQELKDEVQRIEAEFFSSRHK